MSNRYVRLLPSPPSAVLSLSACAGNGSPSSVAFSTNDGPTSSAIGAGETGAGSEPPPPYDATADTRFDLIRTSDESVFACLESNGRGRRTVWDRRVDGEPPVDAWLFRGHYRDGLEIEFVANPEFGSAAAARAEVERLAPALGRLPTAMRHGLERVVVHAGGESPHAGPGSGGVPGSLTMYADTIDERLSHDHLEETLCHEAVHASWEAYRLAPDWIAAQERYPTFLTEHARAHPEREDLPESALFAYALLNHPERLPPADTAETERAIPDRIAYVAGLLPPDEPIFAPSGDDPAGGALPDLGPDCAP